MPIVISAKMPLTGSNNAFLLYLPLPAALSMNTIPTFMDQETLPQNNPFDEPRIVSDQEELFQTYKNQILIGAALVIISIAGATSWWVFKQGQEASAQAALSEADSVEGWTSVADQYANTSAGGFALLQLAESYKKSGDWEAVADAFSRFIEYHKKNPLAPAAQLGYARALEAQKKYDAALNAYQSIISSQNTHPFSAAAQIGLARSYQATGQLEAAKQSLADLIATTTDSPFIAEAENMLKKLNWLFSESVVT